jgi:serine/threonine-protein kinase LATS1/2
MNNNVTSYEINPSIATTTQDSGVETFSLLPSSLTSNSTPGAMASLPAPSASLSMPQTPPCMPTHHVSPKPERRQISTAKEEARKESLIRSCPPQAFKFFMEQHIENVIKEYEKRRDRRMRLERELVQITRESDIQITENDKDKMRMALERKETNYLRMRRAKLNKSHFKKIKDIGVGAFGKVSLVRSVYGTGQNRPGGLYAMKTLKKNQVLAKNQVAHVWSEKDILSEADNDWIVKLYYSFQVKCAFLKNRN